ncbi:MAG: type II secretion system protein [Phycisphaerae bacterium]|jgi:prepilin-type N-terminal cleavage/methylation domain-containing protein/prepilin-type processing-associated H-X9-DG protein
MTRKARGFTLLELLTVIAIIGLLVGILLPSLTAARNHAKANACLSHLKGIGNAFAVYLTENNDVFPPCRLYKLDPEDEEYYVNEYGRRAPRWQWFLETEFGPVVEPAPHRWAVDSVGYFGDYTPGRRGGPDGGTMSHELFTCPSLQDEEFAMSVRDGAYGYNYQYLGNTRQDTSPSRWDNFAVGLHKIRKTAMTVVVADSRGAGYRHGRHSYTLDPPRLATERNATRFGPNQLPYAELNPADWVDNVEADGTEHETGTGPGDMPPGLGSEASIYSYSPAEPRHKDRANVVFVDTHAAAMTLTELGYRLSDGTYPDGARRGVPLRAGIADGVPIGTPPDRATNRMWNGNGVDTMTPGDEQVPDP